MIDQEFDHRMKEIQEQILEEARRLYGEVVMDHALHPRGRGSLENPDGFGRATGPCGDTIEFWLRLKEGLIEQVGFETDGCAATVATASVTGELVRGLQPVAARRAAHQGAILDVLGGLPEENEHCALLAAHAMHAALDDVALRGREPWKKLYGR